MTSFSCGRHPGNAQQATLRVYEGDTEIKLVLDRDELDMLRMIIIHALAQFKNVEAVPCSNA